MLYNSMVISQVHFLYLCFVLVQFCWKRMMSHILVHQPEFSNLSQKWMTIWGIFPGHCPSNVIKLCPHSHDEADQLKFLVLNIY